MASVCSSRPGQELNFELYLFFQLFEISLPFFSATVCQNNFTGQLSICRRGPVPTTTQPNRM